MTKLVLLRHGQSVWNLENRFTGWADVNLSSKGKEEASKAGFILKEKNYKFDIAFSSYLKRAIKTLNIVLEEMNLMWIPIYKSWRLNERHYGTLQGLNKDKTKEKYGKEQVHLWRRSYEIPPPPLERDIHNNNEKNLIHNEKYKELSEIPLAESLKMTSDRCLPYWHNEIAKKIKQGNKIIITAHGNSLRALVKHLDNISNKKILNINIPTGIPLVYELDNELKPLKHYYLNK